MKPKSIIALILGVLILAMGVFNLIQGAAKGAVIPILVGLSLIYMSFSMNRTATIVLGHVFVVIGCFLITWGMHLVRFGNPNLFYILKTPLFWGLFSTFGGICAIYHGFCRCVRKES